MAEWKQVTLSDLLPEEVQQIASDAAGVAQSVADVVEGVGEVVQTVGQWMLVASDPYEALVNAILLDIEALLADLRDAGIYVLPIVPFGLRYAEDFDDVVGKIVSSLDDRCDPDRPQFSQSADVAAAIFLVSGPDLKGLWDSVLKALAQVFDMGAFRELKWLDDPNAFNQWDRFRRSADGREPDWESISLGRAIPVLGDLLNEMLKFSRHLRGLTASTGDFIDTFAQALLQKAAELQTLAQELEDLTDALENLLNLSGVWYVYIEAGGVDGFVIDLQNSTNKPPFDENSFVAGAVFLAGGPSVAQFEGLFKI